MRKENVKKHKINVMDILVILLAVICVCSIVARATSNTNVYKAKEYRVYFEIDDIRSSSFTYFEGHEGEAVRLKSNGKILGTLGGDFARGVAIHTYTENMEDGTKITKQATHPLPENGALYTQERCSISGYIVVCGNYLNNGILFEDESFIKCDQELEVVTEHLEVTIRLTGVSEN